MRGKTQCERARVPVTLELQLDEATVFSQTQEPAGLWKDGPSGFYRSFVVSPGRHTLRARLRDSRRTEGFDYESTREISLAPRQNFVIGFRAEAGGFTFE
jgi:hypothetical protein